MATVRRVSQNIPRPPSCRGATPPRSTARRTASRSRPSSGSKTAWRCPVRSGRIGYHYRQGACSSSASSTGRRRVTLGSTGVWRGMNWGRCPVDMLIWMWQVRKTFVTNNNRLISQSYSQAGFSPQAVSTTQP